MSNTNPPFPGYTVFVGNSYKYLVPSNFVAGWMRPEANELNTLTQQCETAAQLRQFPAFPAMVCFLQGIASPADGLGGMFYWKAGAYTDDNLNIIVPTIRPWPFGAGSEGAWLRVTFPGGGGGSVAITATAPIVVSPSPITNTGVVSHAASGVTAATYGDATHVPQFTVNAFGHVTAAASVPITFPTKVPETVGVNFDKQGGDIPAGTVAYLRVPFAGTIVGAYLVANASGSAVVDVWKGAYSAVPLSNANSICGADKPTLTSAQKYADTTLTGWTTAVAAGDWIYFHMDSDTGISHLAAMLEIDPT